MNQADDDKCRQCGGSGFIGEDRCDVCGGNGLVDGSTLRIHPKAWAIRFDSMGMRWRTADFDQLSDIIERKAEWMKAHGVTIEGLEEYQRAIVAAMIERQVQLGMERGDFDFMAIHL